VCLTIEALKFVMKKYRKVHEIIVNMVHVRIISVDLCNDFKTFYGCIYIHIYIYIYEIVNYLRFLKMVSNTQFHYFALLHVLIVCLLLLLIHVVLVLLDSFVDLLL